MIGQMRTSSIEATEFVYCFCAGGGGLGAGAAAAGGAVQVL